jgi:hypothetical protein
MSPALGSVLIALIVVAGCGASSTSPSPAATSAPTTVSSTASPGAATGAAASGIGLVPDQSCTVEVAPGPDDAPPVGGGDLIDTSHFGPGRWRLCLAPPAVLTLEDTAWCEWNGNRTMVTQVSGHPRAIESTDVDGYVSFDPPSAGTSVTDETKWDRMVNFTVERQPVSIESDPAHLSGRAAFDLAQYLDPELGIVVGAPTAMAGTIAWVCGDPPAAG